ncbi:MAG: ParA family protein [Polyangiaceae bacterium]
MEPTMAANNPTCSVCSVKFELHFSYQLEQREDAENGKQELFYCSQRCLEASHHGRTDGQVACDACAKRFAVELAAQVLFTGGRRHYACSQGCRTRILEGVRQVRLGQIMDPTYPLSDDAATPVTPAPAEVVETIPSRKAQAQNAAPASRPQARSQRVLAVFNHKGGTGKTTTAVHVAAGLAARGQRVLLIDTDGQGNVATSLGMKFERSLYHVIVMGLDYREVVQEARQNLHVVPANETIAAAELYLAGQRSRDRLLASRFAGIREAYDYVVIDCSPSLSLMNQNALVMADAVLCPVACDYLSLVGIQKVVRTIKQINRLLSHPLTFWGVLPTFFDTRARICHEALDTLRGHFREVCLEPIRMASRVKEAPSQGKTLYEYAPGSSAAVDYERVVDRLLGNHQVSEASVTLEGVA